MEISVQMLWFLFISTIFCMPSWRMVICHSFGNFSFGLHAYLFPLLTLPKHSQERCWCWRAQCCALASWTAWGRSFRAPTRFGGTSMPPRTLTGRGGASSSTFHHHPPRTPAERDIWLWCAPRGRPKYSWCPRSLASLSTTSQSHPLYCEPTWYLCATACAWPASVLTDTSWHSGITSSTFFKTCDKLQVLYMFLFLVCLINICFKYVHSTMIYCIFKFMYFFCC